MDDTRALELGYVRLQERKQMEDNRSVLLPTDSCHLHAWDAPTLKGAVAPSSLTIVAIVPRDPRYLCRLAPDLELAIFCSCRRTCMAADCYQSMGEGYAPHVWRGEIAVWREMGFGQPRCEFMGRLIMPHVWQYISSTAQLLVRTVANLGCVEGESSCFSTHCSSRSHGQCLQEGLVVSICHGVRYYSQENLLCELAGALLI